MPKNREPQPDPKDPFSGLIKQESEDNDMNGKHASVMLEDGSTITVSAGRVGASLEKSTMMNESTTLSYDRNAQALSVLENGAMRSVRNPLTPNEQAAEKIMETAIDQATKSGRLTENDAKKLDQLREFISTSLQGEHHIDDGELGKIRAIAAGKGNAATNGR